MWTLFTRALAKGQSTTQVSIMNTSANFVITALLGLAIFAESLPPLWWLGAAMLVAGNVIIGRKDEGPDKQAAGSAAASGGDGGGGDSGAGAGVVGFEGSVALPPVKMPEPPSGSQPSAVAGCGGVAGVSSALDGRVGRPVASGYSPVPVAVVVTRSAAPSSKGRQCTATRDANVDARIPPPFGAAGGEGDYVPGRAGGSGAVPAVGDVLAACAAAG